MTELIQKKLRHGAHDAHLKGLNQAVLQRVNLNIEKCQQVIQLGTIRQATIQTVQTLCKQDIKAALLSKGLHSLVRRSEAAGTAHGQVLEHRHDGPTLGFGIFPAGGSLIRRRSGVLLVVGKAAVNGAADGLIRGSRDMVHGDHLRSQAERGASTYVGGGPDYQGERLPDRPNWS
ncbi:MAG: hypothetical protein LW837_23440 [Roseomonas sp.]|nr:hypothetical protein [Hyphomonadaceae bacterium]MCE2922878.1 hypothetical protein [Roseomonas sp.]